MVLINNLPDELLSTILAAVSAVHHRWYADSGREFLYANGAAAARTCRRFHQLAMPHLYAELHITMDCSSDGGRSNNNYVDVTTTPAIPVPAPTQLLHRSCKRNPALCLLCRRLALHFCQPVRPEKVASNAVDFASWFAAVRTLEIHGMLMEDGGLVAWLLHQRPCLERLVLRPMYRGGLDLVWVVGMLGMGRVDNRRLGALELHSVGMGEHQTLMVCIHTNIHVHIPYKTYLHASSTFHAVELRVRVAH